MSRKRCRHERVAQWFYPDPLREMTNLQHRCAVCDATLSLGPANDEPENVRVEMRAAEIAAQGHAGKCNGGPFEWDCERCGWERWGVNHIELKGRWLAGYLARAIVEHDKEAT